MMMRHLIWKDGHTIRPLMIALLIATVGINALMILLSSFSSGYPGHYYVSAWVLIPNLLALGAPALLIGSEEENGTMGWLRTLPIRWQSVADSKFLVAVVALGLVWIASSIALCLLLPSRGFLGDYASDLLSVSGVAYLLFFSLLLLFSGFVTAYLFRSPVAGLVAVMPMILGLSVGASAVGRWLMFGDTREIGATMTGDFSDYLLLGLAGGLLLFVLWSVQRMLAKRRLVSPKFQVPSRSTQHDSTSAYQPPKHIVGSSMGGKPSQIQALLWQQLRQAGWPSILITLIAMCLAVIGATDFSDGVMNFLSQLSPLLLLLLTCWLGGLVFYGDNVRRRCVFFADRGVSPTTVWATRMLLPMLCCVALVAFTWQFADDGRNRASLAFFPLIVVVFAIGQLAGQWTKRPTLSFFAGPGLVFGLLVFWVQVQSMYSGYSWMALLIAPVLMFASWRLSARWLAGKTDSGYHTRAIGYIGLALFLPLISIGVHRVATTPPIQTAWRADMNELDLPEAAVNYSGSPVGSGIEPDILRLGSSSYFDQNTSEENCKLLEQELASETIGSYACLDDIDCALRSYPQADFDRDFMSMDEFEPVTVHPETKAEAMDKRMKGLCIEVLFHWSTRIRERAMLAKNTMRELELVEASEAQAVDYLSSLVGYLDHQRVKELAALIPSTELRASSRRKALQIAWQNYQQQPWGHRSAGRTTWYIKFFLGNQVHSERSMFAFERRRTDREIDSLTQLLLDQIDELPESSASEGFRQRDELWSAITWPETRLPIGQHWTRHYEKTIESMQRQVAAAQPAPE
ncbi:MAG: hypothetical protein AB8B91_25240 [Rubripirellula sp.]